MFKSLKNLWASKFSINITVITPPSSGVVSTTVPRDLSKPLTVFHLRKSDFRFVEEEKEDWDGDKTVMYYTEFFQNGSWLFASNSMSMTKDKAMERHLALIERGTLESNKTTTILWEGLSKEETQSWVELQKEK